MKTVFWTLIFTVATTLCGLSQVKPLPGSPLAIRGGSPIAIAKAPYQVRLWYSSNFSTYSCGGSILYKRYILTAAHCFDELKDKRHIQVVAGIDDLKNRYGSNAQRFGVKNVYLHPKYNKSSSPPNYDVAILELNGTLKFNAKVQAVTLVSPSTMHYETPGNTAQTTGWGRTTIGGKGSEQLLTTKVRIITTSNLKTYPVKGAKGFPYNAVIGTISNNKSKIMATGKGDSGGALVFKTGTNKYLQVGVTSWGVDKYDPKLSVFARVSAMTSWIHNTPAWGVSDGGRLCSNADKTYTITGNPPDRISWHTSSNIQVVSATQGRISVRATHRVTDQKGWIEARLGNGVAKRLEVRLGVPNAYGAYISGGRTLTPGSWYRIDISGGASGWDKVRWIIPNAKLRGLDSQGFTRTDGIFFSPNKGGSSVSIDAHYTNACGGATSWVRQTFSLSSGSGRPAGLLPQ